MQTQTAKTNRTAALASKTLKRMDLLAERAKQERIDEVERAKQERMKILAREQIGSQRQTQIIAIRSPSAEMGLINLCRFSKDKNIQQTIKALNGLNGNGKHIGVPNFFYFDCSYGYGNTGIAITTSVCFKVSKSGVTITTNETSELLGEAHSFFIAHNSQKIIWGKNEPTGKILSGNNCESECSEQSLSFKEFFETIATFSDIDLEATRAHMPYDDSMDTGEFEDQVESGFGGLGHSLDLVFMILIDLSKKKIFDPYVNQFLDRIEEDLQELN